MADASVVKHVGEKDFISRLLTPSCVGTITAATVALYPLKFTERGIQPLQVSLGEQWAILRELAPVKVVSALLGFAVGYGFMKGLSWARWRLIKMLLSYHGWMYHPKSAKSKMWAVSLKYLQGKGPHGTYTFQNLLPHQPLPELNETLDRFLKVAKLLVSEEDFQVTKTLVEDFRKNEGPKLQAHLAKRAAKQTSWLADYWLQLAYLSGRDPIAINSNFYVSNRMKPGYFINQLARTAAAIYGLVQFEEQIRTEKLPVTMLNGMIPLCMAGYKNLFNTVRLPGEHIDTIQTFPNRPNRHTVIIRNGHYYKMQLYHEDANGTSTPISMVEIKNQLQRIIEDSENLEFGSKIAALTSQNRTNWWKQREVLKLRNKEVLEDIDRAMFVVSLDDINTKTLDEFLKYILVGDGSNRWFDKSINLVMNKNGDHGVSVEHSGIDAYVFVSATEFMFATEKNVYKDGDLDCDKWPAPRELPKPTKLTWNTEDVKDDISNAVTSLMNTADNLDLTMIKAPFSKGYIKKLRVSPDGFIQMAMELAYFRLHKEIPKTYEPATSRFFQLGRTETVHPPSEYSVEWVKVMDDKSVSHARKVDLLKKAIKHQSAFRVDATVGHGCDRHMVGLFCAARELGIMPKVFMDKTFRMPFKLSTSQTPTNIWSQKLDVDYTTCGGGFGPTAADGYGICYPVICDDILTFHISCYKSSGRSVKKMGDAILTALKDMQDIFK